MSFTATVRTHGRTAVVAVTGSLDSSTAPEFRERVDQAIAGDPVRLVIDMTSLEYISSAGLRGLVTARQRMAEGTDIVLVGVQPPVGDTIRLTGFQHSVYFADQVSEAVDGTFGAA